MESPQKTTQTKNIVYGDQAGGNIVHNSYVLQHTTMTHLITKFRAEQSADAQISQFMAELQHYVDSPTGEKIDGLELKLTTSQRTFLLEYASKAKELFAKKLVQYQFSEAAQEILAFLLSHIKSRFHNMILPAIQKGESVVQVGILVQTLIVDHISSQLEQNPLHLSAEEIDGMLYYLTGNCHIRWVA